MRSAKKCMAADPSGGRAYAAAVVVGPNREKAIGKIMRREAYRFIACSRMYALHEVKINERELWPTDRVTWPSKIGSKQDGLPDLPFNRAALAYGLEVYLPILKHIDPDGSIPERDRLRLEVSRISESLDQPVPYLGRFVTVPAFAYVEVSEWPFKVLSRDEALKACLDTLAEWVATGQKPTNLPLDPYSGQPVRLLEVGSKLKVFCVNENRVDLSDALENSAEVGFEYIPGVWWR